MASNQTDICNRALIHIGDLPIVSINDNVKSARTLKAVYNMVRQNELRAHRWSFSIKRASMASLATPVAPAPQFTTTFQVPVDCLRVLLVGNMRQTLGTINYRTGLERLYVIEGPYIYTTLPSPCAIQYIGDITNEGLFDGCFDEAFAAKLAATICVTLTNSDKRLQVCASAYQRAINEACLTNALELPPQGMADDSWVIGRL